MSSLTDDQVRQAAEILAELHLTGGTIAELPGEVRPGGFDDGYRIQLVLHDLISHRRSISSHGTPPMLKVGCTTPVTQKMLSVAEPIGGRLVAEQVYSSGASIPMSTFNHQPLIECEFAFRVAATLEADGVAVDMARLRTVVDAVAPAIELVDNRFDKQLGVDGPSIVADNSMATAVVLGRPRLLGTEIDGDSLASTTVRLCTDDDDSESIANGIGAEVLGDPWVSLLWAIDHEKRLGGAIDAGTWVITGSCAGAPPVPLDQRLTARFPGLGEVSVTIVSAG